MAPTSPTKVQLNPSKILTFSSAQKSPKNNKSPRITPLPTFPPKHRLPTGKPPARVEAHAEEVETEEDEVEEGEGKGEQLESGESDGTHEDIVEEDYANDEDFENEYLNADLRTDVALVRESHLDILNFTTDVFTLTHEPSLTSGRVDC
jgi:hypothetical protein